MKGKKLQRRNYIINKEFQLKYTFLILFLLMSVMLITGIGLYMGLWASIIENFSQFKISQDLETAKRIAGYEEVRFKKGDYRIENIFREAELLSEEQRKAAKKALEAVNRSLLPKVALLAGLIFLGGIFVSHRIAGPMYRFERSAEAVRNGDLNVRFSTRKGDEMRKVASELQGMVDTLRSDIKKMKTAKDKLKTEKDVARLKEYVKEIDKVLSKYNT